MLFKFSKKTGQFFECDETDFKSHAILERKHLEEWVLQFPQVLGEELLVITNEYDKFDKTKERLDVLCIDKDGKLVVVELKREDSGKEVELQAIKYAAYCSTLTLEDIVSLRMEFLHNHDHLEKSEEEIKKGILDFLDNEEFEGLDDKPRIILSAMEFRPEVTASVMWLNKCGLDITCVKMSPYVINNDEVGIVTAQIIPLPEAEEYIVKAERKEALEHTSSISQSAYIEFYREIGRDLEKIIEVALPEPHGKSYHKIPSKLGGVHFEWGFHGHPRDSFGVELHFEKGSKEANTALLGEMEKYKEEIERETGEKPVFERDWGNTWSRLYITRQQGDMSSDQKKWAAEKMALLYKLLNPKLVKAK